MAWAPLNHSLLSLFNLHRFTTIPTFLLGFLISIALPDPNSRVEGGWHMEKKQTQSLFFFFLAKSQEGVPQLHKNLVAPTEIELIN